MTSLKPLHQAPSKIVGLLRIARTGLGNLHLSDTVPLRLAHAKRNLTCGGNNNEVWVIDSSIKEEEPLSMRDTLWVAFAHVVALAFCIHLGIEVGKQFSTVTDPAMQAWQTNTVYTVYVIGVIGLFFGLTVLGSETLRTEVRIVLGMISVAAIGLAGSFLWVTMIHPELPQIMEDVRLVINIRTGQPVSPNMP